MSEITTIQIPLSEATFIGKQPAGDRMLCMHTLFDQDKDGEEHRIFAIRWKREDEKIKEEYEAK